MKMYGLYSVSDIPKLEYNHKKYCDINNIQYNKILISDSLSEKYSHVLACLQKNVGQTLFFIDNFSFFKSFDDVPKLKNGVFLQKHQGKIVDNFFVVKSTEKTIKIFEEVLQFINKNGFVSQDWKNIVKTLTISDEFCIEYPCKQNDKYINIYAYGHSNSLDLNNLLVVNFCHQNKENEGAYFAEVVLSLQTIKHTIPTEKYECFNKGHKTAFVTLYTPNIQNIGIISELNIKQYCLKNNITYHIYRDVSDELKNKNISGTWCKPWLLLQHFEAHENLAWIDSDILIGKNYETNTNAEIVVYKDPYNFFNAGYMMFKTTFKNKELLLSIIEEFNKIEGELNGVYTNNGGDQPRFIKAVSKYYPEYSPLSAMLGNTHPAYPISLSPYKNDAMIHFMGYDLKIREAIMNGYNNILLQQY